MESKDVIANVGRWFSERQNGCSRSWGVERGGVAGWAIHMNAEEKLKPNLYNLPRTGRQLELSFRPACALIHKEQIWSGASEILLPSIPNLVELHGPKLDSGRPTIQISPFRNDSKPTQIEDQIVNCRRSASSLFWPTRHTRPLVIHKKETLHIGNCM